MLPSASQTGEMVCMTVIALPSLWRPVLSKLTRLWPALIRARAASSYSFRLSALSRVTGLPMISALV